MTRILLSRQWRIKALTGAYVGIFTFGSMPDLAYSQCFDWVQRPNTFQPVQSDDPAMFFDTTMGCMVNFGRSEPGPAQTWVTWLSSDAGWLKCTSQNQPSPRGNQAVAFDSTRGTGVLFGGYYNSDLGDTWEWSGFNWTQVATSGPAPRRHSAMAFDSARGVTVLFGGTPSTGAPYGDTWEWDGLSWIQRNIPGPPARYLHRLTYDEARGVVVMCGGAGPGIADDIWEFDSTQWINRTPTGTRPPAHNQACLAYDSLRRVSVLYGGNVANGSNTIVWEWDGVEWHQRASSVTPSSSASHGMMAYDSRRHKMVLVSSETWDYPVNTDVQIAYLSNSRTVCLGGSVSLSVGVNGNGPFTFQWKKGGGIYNAPDASNPTININAADFGSEGEYRVVVSNGCSEATSIGTWVSVCPGPAGCPSPVDVNGDGAVNGLDIQRIVEVLLGG